MTQGESKICASCGRSFSWRKKWERNWDEVRFCSKACRSRRVTKQDEALEATILQLLADRKTAATICPSEAARSVSSGDDEEWRELMEPARRAARRLVAAGQVEITQKGKVVDPSTFKGPIRIRMSGD